MEVLIRVELRRTVQTSCYVKEAGHKRPRAAGSTYASGRAAWSRRIHRERERRRGREVQGKQVAPSWVSFHSEENVPKLIAGMVTQPCGLHNPVKGVNLHN